MSEYTSVSDQLHLEYKNEKENISRSRSGLWEAGKMPSNNYWEVKYHELIDPIEVKVPLRFLLRRVLLAESNDE